jgi:hypothetical protein
LRIHAVLNIATHSIFTTSGSQGKPPLSTNSKNIYAALYRG